MRASQRGTLRELLETVVIAVALALLIRIFVVESFQVQGTSMEPTLQHRDRLIVYKLGYRWASPERGDIIVFHYPLDPTRDFVKRVIAVPGDSIRIEQGRVFVNNVALDEPHVKAPSNDSMPERTVPPGAYFVMGDHRNNSEDSRKFGFVREELIVGKAILVYWPLDAVRLLP